MPPAAHANAGPAPAPAPAPPTYTYHTIAQALELPPLGLCHLYGVVKESTQPKPTRGTGAPRLDRRPRCVCVT